MDILLQKKKILIGKMGQSLGIDWRTFVHRGEYFMTQSNMYILLA